MKNDGCKKGRDGAGRVVYSTNPGFVPAGDEAGELLTPDPGRQCLRVSRDARQRGGKVVTVVSGFAGRPEDLNALGRLLKGRCGVGGSVKDGEVLVQGDLVVRVSAILREEGFRVK